MKAFAQTSFALLAIGSLVASHPASAQDARRGEHVFKRCLLCHVLDPKATNLLAPPLHNVLGRRAASIPGFQYSEIMKLAGTKGLTWSSDALFHFLDRPEAFMPGTYMAFAGLDEPERLDVIAYLEKITKEWDRNEAARAKGTPTPDAAATPPTAAPPAPAQRPTRPTRPPAKTQ